jgi:hypothetical protein
VDDEVEAYLNRADVQAALHANDSAHALPWAWKDCNPRIKYNQCGGCVPVSDPGCGADPGQDTDP